MASDRQSLPVESVEGEVPLLLADGHQFQLVKALGWECLPAGSGRRGAATFDQLLVSQSDAAEDKGFSQLEFGEGLLAAKQVHVKKYPETKHGSRGGGRNGKGTRRKTGVSEDGTPVRRFTQVAAEAYGVGETRVKNLIRAADKLEGKTRRDFAAGRISLEEALAQLRKPRNSAGGGKLAKAIWALKRALENAPSLSAKDRERLEELLPLIQEAVRKGVVSAQQGTAVRKSAARKGGADKVVCEDGAVRMMKGGSQQ